MSRSTLPSRVRCVVVGTGALGSAAAYRLARRLGDQVLVLEQFTPGHTRGASEDHSRIIRHSYHSTTYTTLTRAMFAAWREVEAESGIPLISVTGGLDFGDPRIEGSVDALHDNAAALAAEKIDFEFVDPAELRRRWPQWRMADDVQSVYQADAGSLDIGRACSSHLALAVRHGARLHPRTRALSLEPAGDDGGVRVHTDAGVVETDDLVLCAGKWTNRILGDLAQLPLTYTREQVTYFVPPRLRAFAPERFPIWIRQGDPCFYGFGTHGIAAIKAGEDLGGPEVEVDDHESPIDTGREQRVQRFLAEHLPDAVGPIVQSRACLYELPPDRDFLLGPLPQAPRVHIALGAGHAAKFGALFGIILSDLVLDGASTHPIHAFRLDRPALVADHL
jgi:glycine/D-amino acid oxidase-like deaminating enzyme